MLNQRFAANEMQRLAGKPARSEPRRDDSENFHAGFLASNPPECTIQNRPAAPMRATPDLGLSDSLFWFAFSTDATERMDEFTLGRGHLSRVA